MTPAPLPDPQPTVVRELILTGSPLDLTLPDVCARCGATATKRLAWDRIMSVYDSDSGYSNVIVLSRAPFCGQCLAQHEREVKRMPLLTQLLHAFRSQSIIPAILASLGATFCAWKFLTKLWKPDLIEIAIFGAVAAILGVIALICFRSAWADTHHHRVPPLTTITGSFSFGQDLSELFEGERHRYVLVNDAFFEALLAANRDKLWKPGGAHARRAVWKRKVLYVALGVAAAFILAWDWIKPWLSVEW